MKSWSELRADFPILDQQVHGHSLVYLDSAATTQKPESVIQAIGNFYRRDNSNVHRGIHELSNRATAGFEGARQRTAAYLNAASPEEIIFTRGTTEGVNLVAFSWGEQNVRRGDRILLTEMEHHSNIVPWQLLAERKGATLAFVPVSADGCLELDELDQLLAPPTRIFAFTHISNSLGTINPAAELCARARQAGVATLVDAAQSAGHMPLDVAELDCDFLAFSGHKMCAPTGIGVLHGRRRILESLPPFQGGGDMIASVEFQRSTWNRVPHKFEAGTPDIAGAVGLHAAMDYLDGIGRERIGAHDRELGAYCYARLKPIPGIRLLGPETGRAGLVSFHLQGVHAHDLVMFADQYGIALRGGHHCTQPLMRKFGLDSTSRASCYLYTTREEIDAMAGVVEKAQAYFG